MQFVIDDAKPLSYGEVLPDDHKSTTVGYQDHPVVWFSEQGITCTRVLSENEFSFRSGEWLKASRALDIKPILAKPYTPQTNGK